MVTMRQEKMGLSPTTTQGEAIGHSFPLDGNSKARRAGQLRKKAGLCPDHTFLISEVRRPPQPHVHQKGSSQVKRESCQGMFCTHTPFQ